MKYVIIGGDAAGMSAAMQIVRHDSHADVTTVEAGSVYSYSQCGLPYFISGDIHDTEQLVARSYDTFREKYNIEARINHEVTAIDTDNKKVSGIIRNTNSKFTLDYDRLLIATGASPVMPDLPGHHYKGIYTLKTLSDAETIKEILNGPEKDVTIVGGGYIGLEMAEAFVKRGKHVTLIERSSHIAKILDQDMAEIVQDIAKKQGIRIVLNEEVKSFKGDDTVHHVCTNQNEYPAQLVLIAVGEKPNVGFTPKTIEKGKNGSIQTNEYMETSVKDVYAAGDCTSHYHLVKNTYDHLPLGTTANKQGRIAGLNMVGKNRAFRGITGTSIIKFFSLTIGRSGLSEKEAKDAGYSIQTVKIKTTDIAHYLPESSPIHIKLIANERDGRLLGGQIIGYEGVDKHVDVIATALFNKMSVHDLEDLDLAYAPPYNSVWDPVQQASRRFNH